MLFSSIPFLYTFLPCVLVLYFLAPRQLKNTVLLLSSLFFYAWGEPRFVVFMVIAIVQGYMFGLLAEKYRSRPAGEALPVGLCGHQSGAAGILQVRGLFHQRLQPSHRPVRPAAPRGAAHRHQLLHLPDFKLRH